MDKAPGLDCFAIALWLFKLEFAQRGGDGFLLNSYGHDKLLKSLSVTFLVLIYEKRGVKELKDFSPIKTSRLVGFTMALWLVNWMC